MKLEEFDLDAPESGKAERLRFRSESRTLTALYQPCFVGASPSELEFVAKLGDTTWTALGRFALLANDKSEVGAIEMQQS